MVLVWALFVGVTSHSANLGGTLPSIHPPAIEKSGIVFSKAVRHIFLQVDIHFERGKAT